LLRRLIARWQGIVLALIGIVATVWLAITDRLGLYIHPRYFEFTVIMAVIGAVLVVAAFAFTPLDDGNDGHDGDDGRDGRDEHDEHGHSDAAEPALGGHGHDLPAERRRPTRLGMVRAAIAVAIVAGAAIALLVLPPATLTSATATQRSINSASSSLDQDAPALVGGDTSQFSVKDWALLIRQNPDADYYADKSVDVVGFVTESPDDPDVFYVARFAVTCCAVDAQPVGVPVYLPRWQEQYTADEWVAASGTFAPNPGSSSAEQLLLIPEDLAVTEQPSQPYVF
jgi:putative membrane protein